MDKKEQRLANPVDWHEEYLWAILSELRDLRKALTPEKSIGEDVKLREAADKGNS